MPRWLHAPELRNDAGRQLNRGERRQSLGRWLFFAHQGEFREGDYEEIVNKARCLSSISNAVLAWNTLEIQKIVEELRAGERQVKDEGLARVSPLLPAHAIPNGSYDCRSTNAGATFEVATHPYQPAVETKNRSNERLPKITLYDSIT